MSAGVRPTQGGAQSVQAAAVVSSGGRQSGRRGADASGVTMASADDVLKTLQDVCDLRISSSDRDVPLLTLGVTSYTMVRLLMRLEDEFGFEFSADELTRVVGASASDLCEVVLRALDAYSQS